jgi:hypothetical protein
VDLLHRATKSWVVVDARGTWARAGAATLSNATQAPATAKVNFMKFSESLVVIDIGW